MTPVPRMQAVAPLVGDLARIVCSQRTRLRRVLAACASLATTVGLVGCAVAPVVATDLATGQYPAALEVNVDSPAGVQVVVREITIQPGAGTGEHCHLGQLVGVVKQGVLTHYAPIYPSGVHEYVAGDAIVEGTGYVHEGRNEGEEPVVLEVTYLIAAGAPLAETDLAQCDPR